METTRKRWRRDDAEDGDIGDNIQRVQEVFNAIRLGDIGVAVSQADGLVDIRARIEDAAMRGPSCK
jgi:hypothetical protein